jgi:hypothetical protein
MFLATGTSTPKKRLLKPSAITESCSPLFLRAQRETPNQDKNTPTKNKIKVEVKVEWPSKTKINTLHEGLELLGKMLCRGIYKKNEILKKRVQQLFLQEVDRECTHLCSLKSKSVLRSPCKGEMIITIDVPRG